MRSNPNLLASLNLREIQIGEDFHDTKALLLALSFAVESIQNLDMETAGIALNASLALYAAIENDKCRSAAISYGDYILQCQQRTDLSERVPLKGFFFQDASRERLPLLRSISTLEKYAVTGLVGLLKAFPDSEHAKAWETAIRLYSDYHKIMAAYTDPYFMLPAGLCDVNSAQDEIERAKITNGIRLDDRFYVRCFPVWTPHYSRYPLAPLRISANLAAVRCVC
jgi:hypothetical protein